MPHVPTELHDEIIGYLWNDRESLKACSLANKVMVVPCQRRLFHCIFYISDGTSAKFLKLITKSPHIAGYVVSLFIRDHINLRDNNLHSESIDPLDAPMVAYTESEEQDRRGHQLPQDKYLPDVAPLLCNLRALTISYTGKWRHLSFRVFNSLVHIMQLPSLLYVRIERGYPDCIFDLAMGDNVRHLSVGPYSYNHEEPFSVHQISHPPSGLICIESLFTTSSVLLDSLLRSTPTRRISTRRLRKLVLKTDEPVTQAFLEICDALEDLKVIVDSRSTLTPVICLGKLTTMARFTASLGFPHELLSDKLITHMPWVHQALLFGSPLANQALREITIEVGCYYGKDYYSISEWKEIFDTLDRYPNLAVLNIAVDSHNASGGYASEKLIELLDTCDDIERLRSQENVDVRVCHVGRPILGLPSAANWTPWTHIDYFSHKR